jgi:regulatory protein
MPAGDGPPAPERDSVEDGSEPPLYESLFGGEGDTRRSRRRERAPATAMQRALGLLTRREHSRKELTRKLVSRGVDAAEVEAAVEKLAGAGWQDERRFAENLVRARASTGYGPLHIRAELSTHDLPADLRQEALDGFDGDWSEIAADLVRRRFGRLVDARLRERKAVDFLIRRGFPTDVARAAGRAIPDGD